MQTANLGVADVSRADVSRADARIDADTTRHQHAVIACMARMPAHKQAEVLDFARFLVMHLADTPDDVVLDAEDAQWEATTARYADKLETWRAQVRDEAAAGTTRPMFDAEGRWTLEEGAMFWDFIGGHDEYMRFVASLR